MIPRYAPQQIAKVFSDASRLQRWLDVELLACEGWAEIGRIPVEALSALQGATIDAERIAELEAEQGHDIAAFVAAVQETVGDAGRYFHLGLTSSDVVDTALATQLRDAAAVIDADLESLIGALIEQAERHRLTVMMGRTHGVHAEPLTFGIKLANFVDEVRRSRERLTAATAEIAVGQITGAVGTHASVPPEVEEHVCQGLHLATAPVATQVLARDRHASFITALALLGAVLERLATTIRLLQITEVDEAEEPFGQRQKGSSSMPHKRNPILCERICGLARVLRGYAMTSMEDVALWHERDFPTRARSATTSCASRLASSRAFASSPSTWRPTSSCTAAWCSLNRCSPRSSSTRSGRASVHTVPCRRSPPGRVTTRGRFVTLCQSTPTSPKRLASRPSLGVSTSSLTSPTLTRRTVASVSRPQHRSLPPGVFQRRCWLLRPALPAGG